MKSKKNKFRNEKNGTSSKYPRHLKNQALSEDAEKHLSIKREYLMMGEELNGDYYIKYSKLYRFLDSRLKQPWDQVYSEFCKFFNSNPKNCYEVKNALSRNVITDSILVNGEICNSKGEPLNGLYWWISTYYIHPETKLLEKIPPSPKYRQPAKTQRIFNLNGVLYYKHTDDLWYVVKMQELDIVYHSCLDIRPSGTKCHKDEFFGYFSSEYYFPTYYTNYKECSANYGTSPNNKFWYCTNKRSANSKEIKKVKEKFSL